MEPLNEPYEEVKKTPFVTLTALVGKLPIAPGVAVVHKVVPLLTSIPTQPPFCITFLEGTSVKYYWASLLMMFV
jgi:hypothetical protein